jgi:hypothetical protein
VIIAAGEGEVLDVNALVGGVVGHAEREQKFRIREMPVMSRLAGKFY